MEGVLDHRTGAGKPEFTPPGRVEPRAPTSKTL